MAGYSRSAALRKQLGLAKPDPRPDVFSDRDWSLARQVREAFDSLNLAPSLRVSTAAAAGARLRVRIVAPGMVPLVFHEPLVCVEPSDGGPSSWLNGRI